LGDFLIYYFGSVRRKDERSVITLNSFLRVKREKERKRERKGGK